MATLAEERASWSDKIDRSWVFLYKDDNKYGLKANIYERTSRVRGDNARYWNVEIGEIRFVRNSYGAIVRKYVGEHYTCKNRDEVLQLALEHGFNVPDKYIKK